LIIGWHAYDNKTLRLATAHLAEEGIAALTR